MSQNVGTLKKAVIDGETFNVAADGKFDFTLGQYETEGQATTGETLFKMTKRPENMEGLELQGTPAMLERLRPKVNSLADVTLAVTTIDGSTYRGTGRITADKWDSSTGKVSVNLIPAGEWTAFLP